MIVIAARIVFFSSPDSAGAAHKIQAFHLGAVSLLPIFVGLAPEAHGIRSNPQIGQRRVGHQHGNNFGNFVGATVIDRPPAYLVGPGVAEHLARHGLAVEPAPAAVDAEVATVAEIASEGGRKILESAAVGDLRVEWKRGSRSVPAKHQLVRTDQPLGAIAVYLCEPESDDGAVENGLVTAPAQGAEFPIWRVIT